MTNNDLKNVYVNGKPVWDGLKCPLCGSQIVIHSFQWVYGLEERLIPVDPFIIRDSQQVSMGLSCRGCGAELDITGSDAIFEYRIPKE